MWGIKMSYVRTKAIIGDPQKTKLEEVEFLADKRKAKAVISNAYFKLLDREGIFQTAIMDVPEPLLGVTVLEGLGIRIDPCTGKLEYSRPYGLAIL